MTIDELIIQMRDIITWSDTPAAYCNIEEGIRFFYPPCSSAARGTIFLGSYSEWRSLCRDKLLQPECTYLISIDKEKNAEPIPCSIPINVLFFCAPVSVIRKELTAFLMNFSHQLNRGILSAQYLRFWNDIMSMELSDRQQILERLDEFPYQLHTHIACVVVRSSVLGKNDTELLEAQKALQDFFPGTNLFYTGTEWILIYSQAKDTSDYLDISYEAFSSLLEQYKLEAGISYACRLPEILRTLYLTASASLELGKKLGIAPQIKGIYTYHQYNTYYVIQLCAQRFTVLHKTDNLIYLTHPDVTRIYYYDLEHHNNLLDVLFTYLICGKNIALTSQRLYMHRNTILNKLNKIEEFLQHRLEYDEEHLLLLLSCIIVKYQQFYTQRPLQDFFSTGIIPDD